ncbi:MAG: MAPEG family protein [Kofleriaceae bacterium]
MTTNDVLLYSTALTWLMIMTASLLHGKGNVRLGISNRDDMPERSPLAARADRAAKNMLENMVLFVALIVATSSNPERSALGPQIFFFARLAYWPTYLAGIKYVRSALWAIAIAGLVLMIV